MASNPAGASQPVYEEPATFPEYEFPDPNLFQMTSVPPEASNTASRRSGRASEPGVSSGDAYAGLAGSHKTYAPASEMMLPGQIFAAAAAAAAYEDLGPARRWTRRQLQPTSAPQSHIYHLAAAGDSSPGERIYHLAGDSGDYVDTMSEEQIA
jgi:hypothetical protein